MPSESMGLDDSKHRGPDLLLTGGSKRHAVLSVLSGHPLLRAQVRMRALIQPQNGSD